MPQSNGPADGSKPFPPPTATDPQSPETLDDVFACLTHRHRRHLVETLAGRSEPIAIEAAVRQISSRADHAQVAPADKSDEVRLALLHNHLPRMDAAGVVSLDDGTRSVGKGDQFDVAASVLEVV